MNRETSERYIQENESYKTIIRNYVKSQLLDPLKKYPTTVSDAILHVIIKRLEELYLYTVRFPEIVSPNYNRLDILQAILDQFDFTIRSEDDISEQIDILENILYVYRRRGSVDTIENMWKYYGGNLPNDLKVKIPSYNLFRYNLSKLSGTHVFPDGDTNRTGVYEIVLNNTSNYSVESLKEFMLRELVAAGNRIYFTHSLYSLLIGEDASYKYEVSENILVTTELLALATQSGMSWSGSHVLSGSNKSSLSGNSNIFVDILRSGLLFHLDFSDYKPLHFFTTSVLELTSLVDCCIKDVNTSTTVCLPVDVNYTSEETYTEVNSYSYDRDGNLITNKYPGYFVLSQTLLGSEVS